MDLMWLFTVPVLKIAIKVAIILAAVFLIIQIIRWSLQSKPPNPFSQDSRQPRRAYVHDQKKRDAVLKQGFSMDKVPEHLDAIIIGSGIGGMTTGAVMSKAGKRVLVLEQHDQAGGCCHSFMEHGYEWDVGIHYIGEMGSQTLNKTLLDQVCEGQIEWAPLDDDYDVVHIGYDEETSRDYTILTPVDKWISQLKKQFPDEHQAIDKFFTMINKTSKSSTIHGAMKLIPLWLVKLVLASGIMKLVTNLFQPEYTRPLLEVVTKLTSNKDLQTIFMYCWGDYGCPPSKTTFVMQALLHRHFSKGGGFYPVGGSSEIAYNIIPVIERSGGRVLVRANVVNILEKQGKVCGVRVKKGTETHDIFAPMIISSAGVYNTFQKLLPPQISSKSYYSQICRDLKPGVAAMNVFLGLSASAEELGVKRQNMWAFTDNNIDQSALDYFNLSVDEALDAEVPLMFISFPSAKDPEWSSHPGRENKTTCAIVTLANWSWFSEWQDGQVKKRGDEYEEIKQAIGHKMIEQTCKLYPQIADKIDFTEIATPVTNKYYLEQPHGEIYGLDHSIERLDPLMVAKLRPETDVPGLYLTGQDILTCGFTGGLFAGVIAAQAVLGRNVMGDLVSLHTKIKKSDKKKDN